MNESIWSKEAPTEPGWYWTEFKDGSYEIVKILDEEGETTPSEDDIIKWGQRIELWNPPPEQKFPVPEQAAEITDIMEYRREVSRRKLIKQLERDGLKDKE